MLIGTFFAIVAGMGFAMLGILARFAYAQGMDVGQAMLCRFVLGSLILFLPLAIFRRDLLHLDRRGLLWAAILGMGFYCGQSTFFCLSIKYIPVATTTLIIYSSPAGVALLEWLTGRAKPTSTLWSSLALTLTGCTLVCADAFGRHVDMLGLGYAVITTACYTLYLFFSQTATRGRRPLTVSLYVILFAAIGFLIMNGPARLLDLPAGTLPLAVGLAVIPTALAITALFLAVERIGSAYASIGAAVEPAAALAFAQIFLGEPITLLQVAGTALILAGIALPNLRQTALPAAQAG